MECSATLRNRNRASQDKNIAVTRDLHRRPQRERPQAPRTSSVHTLKLVKVLGPNVLLIATSEASRPRAISTLPIRGVLLRASNVYQRPSRNASNQPRNPSGHTAAARRYRRDSRCSSARGCSCSGRTQPQDARNRDRRPSFVERLERGPCHARMLIAEADVPMNVVADRLNAAPPGRRLPEQVPRRFGQPVGFAIAAAEQELPAFPPAGSEPEAAAPAARPRQGRPLSFTIVSAATRVRPGARRCGCTSCRTHHDRPRPGPAGRTADRRDGRGRTRA